MKEKRNTIADQNQGRKKENKNGVLDENTEWKIKTELWTRARNEKGNSSWDRKKERSHVESYKKEISKRARWKKLGERFWLVAMKSNVYQNWISYHRYARVVVTHMSISHESGSCIYIWDMNLIYLWIVLRINHC
jgi:hypothetical protein